MSLINDALKRARKAPRRAPETSSGEAPLQPAEGAASAASRSRLALPLLGGVALVLAGWFFWQWWTGPVQPPPTAATQPPTNRLAAAARAASNVVQAISNRAAPPTIDATNAPVVAAQETSPAKITNAVAQTESATSTIELAAAPEVRPKATNPAAASDTASTAAAAAAPISTTTPLRSVNFPPMQLQAIYYRLSKPSALINNRTLYLGDEIEGARVVAIERHTVRLEMGGRTKDLTLK